MAKLGEGDSRWIVTDRPDGTNVHNWHWSETDCLEYSRIFFNNSLTGLPVLNGEGGVFIKINKVEKLDGEAYVNIRKGKIIPGYELSLTVSWAGESKGADGGSLGKWDGTVEIPYVSDENAGEAPEVKVTFKDDGPIGKRIKEAFIANGKAVILQKVKEFEEAMARGGPCREELEAKKVAPKAAAATSKAEPQVAVKKDEAKAKQKEKEKERRGYRTIKLSEKFRCRAVDLYEILMDENRWKGFTQSNAKISKEVGGEFSIFDGSVTGTHVDLQEGKLIVQKWRFGNWADGVFSTVKLNFKEPESGVTVVELVQTDVPEEDRYGNETVVENTERGWRDLIFQRIRAIFGFGL